MACAVITNLLFEDCVSSNNSLSRLGIFWDQNMFSENLRIWDVQVAFTLNLEHRTLDARLYKEITERVTFTGILPNTLSRTKILSFNNITCV